MCQLIILVYSKQIVYCNHVGLGSGFGPRIEGTPTSGTFTGSESVELVDCGGSTIIASDGTFDGTSDGISIGASTFGDSSGFLYVTTL